MQYTTLSCNVGLLLDKHCKSKIEKPNMCCLFNKLVVYRTLFANPNIKKPTELS